MDDTQAQSDKQKYDGTRRKHARPAEDASDDRQRWPSADVGLIVRSTADKGFDHAAIVDWWGDVAAQFEVLTPYDVALTVRERTGRVTNIIASSSSPLRFSMEVFDKRVRERRREGA